MLGHTGHSIIPQSYLRIYFYIRGVLNLQTQPGFYIYSLREAGEGLEFSCHLILIWIAVENNGWRELDKVRGLFLGRAVELGMHFLSGECLIFIQVVENLVLQRFVQSGANLVLTYISSQAVI